MAHNSSYLRNMVLVIGIYIALSVIVAIISCLGRMTTDQVLSLAQLVTECALVPIAVVGFSITLSEFRKTQLAPSIRLYLGSLSTEQRTDAASFEAPDHGGKQHMVPILAENGAATVAVWWQVEFVVPRALFVHQPPLIDVVWSAENIGGTFTTITKADGFQITFLSKGETALFSKVPLEMGKLHFSMTSDHPIGARYEIPYMAVSDRGPAFNGTLVISRDRPRLR